MQLCPLPVDAGGPACPTGTVCMARELFGQAWGFCLPCASSGSDGGPPGLCMLDGDCCEGNCATGFAGVGYCQPRGD